MGADAPLLQAESLSLERAGRQLFSDLSFRICGGQLVQLEGANGAGKTSLIRILAGLSRYGFEGGVQRLAPMLYLGHQPAVKALLTPRENLAWHTSGSADPGVARIDEALEKVGLYGYEDVPSHALSAGQHRRVNLARLYLAEQPLWLLDEPFTAIDKGGVKELESLFQRHVESGGAVLVTSHQSLQVQCPLYRLDLQRGVCQ